MIAARSTKPRATAAILACALLAAMMSAVSAIHAADARPPIIIIPGAPGTELIDSATGKLVWPNAWLMAIKDGTDCLALPLDDPEAAPVVPGGIVRSVKVVGMKFPIRVYGGLEKKLKKLGYKLGDWNAPHGGAEYFYFPYDWRQSVEVSGRRFAAMLADLYTRTPEGTPPAIVLGHSLGGLIARYALMYGDAPLGDTGPLPPVTWAGGGRIGTLFLVATPNQGTFIALKRLEQGIYYRGHRGAFSRETLFTFPSVFDVIPSPLVPLVDDKGRELPFRLDDPADWERLGWSVVDETDVETATPREALRAHLAQQLARSARLRAALDQLGSTPNPATVYGVLGLTRNVQRTAVVTNKKGKMKVRFDPPAGTRGRLAPILYEPGDSMVSARSLSAEGSSHDPASSLSFSRVVTSKRSHHALLSSPEMLDALDEALK